MRHWLSLDHNELTAFLTEAGQPKFRAKQVWDWLHGKRVPSFDAMGNLPAPLRERLNRDGVLRAFEEVERRDAADGLTSKWLWRAQQEKGCASDLLESVLIIEKRLSRRTVCVSCMVGCPLDCRFCATGKHGFVRNLSSGEILEQVYRMGAFSRDLGEGMGVSHVVFMGMGEPLLNLDAVARTARVLCDAGGMNLSGRHITISTAGVPDGIRELARMGVAYRLAVSLHASNQAARERIMPCARRWRLPELFAALEEFAAVSSRDITFEYCLIDGVNADSAQARELVKLLAPFRCKVNLIPLNPVPGISLRPPSAQGIRRFQEILEASGISAPVRMEKGAEIGAACGQLRAEKRLPDDAEE